MCIRDSNMRVQLGGDAGDHEFSTNLLNLEDGKISDVDGEVHLTVHYVK